MIIGSNNNENKFKNNSFLNEGTQFDNKMKQYKNNTHSGNIFVKDIKQQAHSNINSKDEMYNKSLSMLNERLSKGLISMDEFTKQVNLLAKRNK